MVVQGTLNPFIWVQLLVRLPIQAVNIKVMYWSPKPEKRVQYFHGLPNLAASHGVPIVSKSLP